MEVLRQFESAAEILANYDAKVSANFVTHHNDNKKTKREINIQLPDEITKLINEYVKKRIFETKKVLETL